MTSAPRPGPPAGDGRPPARLSVLVVDDDPDTAESTAQLLRLCGYAASAATDGPAALSLADRDPPDVALVDLAMPGMDGCAVARRLRGRAGPYRPLLVAVTGYAADADRRRTAAAGFDLHLLKPVPPDDLLHLLARFARVLGR